MGNTISSYIRWEYSSWSNLPWDLLNEIGELLKADIGDYVRFRSVCKSWRWATADLRNNKIRHPPQTPWLVIEYKRSYNRLSFFAPSDGKRHFVTLPWGRKYGSMYVNWSREGWLVVNYPDNLDGFMVNPVTRAFVHFPPSSTLPGYRQIMEEYDETDYVFGTVATDRNPTSALCTFVVCLMVIPALVSFRAGDTLWTMLVNNGSRFSDVIHFKGQFVATTVRGQVYVYNSKLVLDRVIEPPEIWTNQCRYWHLTESSCGNNIIMSRNTYSLPPAEIHHGIHKGKNYTLKVCNNDRVDIFSLNLECPMKFWTQVKSLDDQILFLGCCGTASIPKAVFPLAEKDTIYLAEDNFEDSPNCYIKVKSGIYNLKTGKTIALPWGHISGIFWHKPCYY